MGFSIDAGAVVLLGLGCLAAEFTGLAEKCSDVAVNGKTPAIEEEISATFNAFIDIAAIALIINRVRIYLEESRRIINTVRISDSVRADAQSRLDELVLDSPIYFTLAFVEFFKFLAGFLSPYEGESLQRSAAQLGELHDLLDLASPNSRWVGVAAKSYENEVTQLQSLVSTLARRDKDLAASAQYQADLVLHTRLALGVLEGLLIVATDVEYDYWVVEPEKAPGFALQASRLGMFALYVILLVLPGFVSITSKLNAKRAFHDYRDVAHTPVAGSALASLLRAEMGASPSTGVSDFADLVAGVCSVDEPAVSVEAVAPVERFVGLSAEAYRQLPLAGRPPGPPQRSVSRVLPSRRPDRQTAGQAAPAQVGPVGSDVDGAGAPAVSERVPVEVAVRGPELAGSAWQT